MSHHSALGRRIQRTPSSGVSTNFSYDGADVVRDKNSDATTIDYLNGPGVDNKIWQKGAAQYFFSQDHLGSTTALTNASGALVERETYDAYGNTVGSLTRYGYTGRERDATTGLMCYRARWYDAQVARFASEDPIGLAGGINQFAYVGNNPQNRVDPSGLYEIDVHYYLTYYLALKTGCFEDWEAREIAEWDQRSDEDGNKLPGPFYAEHNVKFHSFGTHEQNAERQAELWRLANRRRGMRTRLGTFLHFLQDSFSHYIYAGNANFGQARDGHSPDHTNGHSPDHTNGDVGKAMDMAVATWDALSRFGSRHGCPCQGSMSLQDWRNVRRFLEVGYDLSTAQGRHDGFWKEISDEQLRLKIQILGVPWRSQNGRSQP